MRYKRTNKQAIELVLSEANGGYVHYLYVTREIQERRLSDLSGATPGNTVNRDLNQMVEEGTAQAQWKGFGYFRLRENNNGQQTFPGF